MSERPNFTKKSKAKITAIIGPSWIGRPSVAEQLPKNIIMEIDESTTTEQPKKTRNRSREIPKDWKQRKIKLSDDAYQRLVAKAGKMTPSVFLDKLIKKNF